MRVGLVGAVLLCAGLGQWACQHETVGMQDPSADGSLPDAAPDPRCADWTPTPGELQPWNSTSGVGERHAAGAAGQDGTVLVVWATDDGVWGRARCASGAPLLDNGLDMRLDDGADRSLFGPDVAALPDGRFAVTWRDDADASLRARWVDADGQPLGDTLTISTADATALFARRPPRVVLLSDGDLVFVWNHYLRRYSIDGVPLDDSPHALENGDTLDVAASVDGNLLWLHDKETHNHAPEAVDPSLATWTFDLVGEPQYWHGSSVWPLLWHSGRRGFALANTPDFSKAAVAWLGNWPYEIRLSRVSENGLCDDAEVLGDAGGDLDEDGWVDVALDGLGDLRVVWRKAQVSGEIHTWTASGGDQILWNDWGNRPHFPRVAGYPDGGFLLLLAAAESHLDEDVRFVILEP